MTTLQQVAQEARGGATAGTIAARLGTSPGLVEAMLDELVRQSVLAPGAMKAARCGGASGASPCTADVRPPSCAGCPLAGRSTAEPSATAPGGVRRLLSVGLWNVKRPGEAGPRG